MKIAVLGAGNMGCAVAADLSHKGHEVTLIKTSTVNFETLHGENFRYLCENSGKIEMWSENSQYSPYVTNISCVTDDISVISAMDLIYIAVVTNFHETFIQKISPYLQNGQIVLIVPGYLSTVYFLKYCKNISNITIVEGESSPIDCRITAPGKVRVGFMNVRNPVGCYTAENLSKIREKLDSLQHNFEYLGSVAEAALQNPNLIVHTVGAIMSIPRIEKTNGDYCMYWEVFTPAVWNILEKLDSEKMQILQKLGLPAVAYVDACKHRNSLDDSRAAKDVFMEYAASPFRAKGPTSLESRYIMEDVPQGLVLLESLAKSLKIAVPTATALIELANAALLRDFRAEGRTIEKLGLENVQKILKIKEN
ncbi:MAG: NAD/NADP octopine/nopaline dehydrogenase family protein [Firmicutes bacterium]|nr:NAD/NADP octopine/nopaline dehydrogenase family protein [Bacillota bacterium]